MIIECPSCRARYQYDEARFEQKPAKKIRCAKCAHVFEIRNPASAAPAAHAPAAEAPVDPEAPADAGLPVPQAPSKPSGTAASDDVVREASTESAGAPAADVPPEELLRPPADTVAAAEVGDYEPTLTRRRRANAAPPKPTAPAGPLPAIGMPAFKRISLAVINGPAAGTVYRVEQPRVTVGGEGSDLVVDAGSRGERAAVEIRDTLYVLCNLGEEPPTMFDGQPVEEMAEIGDKTEFVLGESTIMLIVTEDAGQ